MPEQKPSSRIISRSKVVRWRSRSASSSMPSLAQLLDADLHLLLDVDDGRLQLVGRRHVVRGGIDVELVALGEQLAGQRVELGDPLDLVAEELDAHDEVVVGRLELERVAADAEPGARQRRVVALVLQVDQLAQDAVAPVAAAHAQPRDGGAVVDGRAQAVDARHAGDDDRVAPLEQRPRRGVAQLVDLVVARRVLLDVRVGARQVRLGLVVVEVGDEVLDRVVREELAELASTAARRASCCAPGPASAGCGASMTLPIV